MSASTQNLEVTFSAWTKALNTEDLKTFWEFFDEESDRHCQLLEKLARRLWDMT
jgi:hypothetical protein